MKFLIKYFQIGFLIIFISCSTNTNKSDYTRNIEERREITNDWMENDPNSPFNFKGEIEFDELKYFDVDSAFVFRSKLMQYENKALFFSFLGKYFSRERNKFSNHLNSSSHFARACECATSI